MRLTNTLVLVVPLLAACQLVLGLEDRGVADADADAGSCDPLAPFTSFDPVTEINTPDYEKTAWLSADELTIYFTRAPANPTNGGGPGNAQARIFMATRTSTTLPFSGESVVSPPTDEKSGGDLDPLVTSDGLGLWFSSYRKDVKRLFLSSRQTPADPWGSPVYVNMGTGYEEYEPSLTGDGAALYFTSTLAKAGEGKSQNIYRKTFGPGGGAGPVDYVDGLNTPRAEKAAVVSADDRIIYFSATVPPAHTDYNIWVATRAQPSDPWGERQMLPELSSIGYDAPVWISPDLCTLYVSADRPGGAGNHDLYVARRQK